jgi:hypothetical protein
LIAILAGEKQKERDNPKMFVAKTKIYFRAHSMIQNLIGGESHGGQEKSWQISSEIQNSKKDFLEKEEVS